jgi:hypothetical protein
MVDSWAADNAELWELIDVVAMHYAADDEWDRKSHTIYSHSLI